MIERNAIEYSLSDLRIAPGIKGNVTVKNSSNSSEYCWMHNADNHDISSCRMFLSKSNEERVNLVKENSACWTCLHKGHQSKDCPIKSKCSVDGCHKLHNVNLHGGFVAGIVSHNTKEYSLVDPCNLCQQILENLFHKKNVFLNILIYT